MTRQAYLAANLFNEFRDEVAAITVETASEMATLNGARAVGMEDEVVAIGSPMGTCSEPIAVVQNFQPDQSSISKRESYL